MANSEAIAWYVEEAQRLLEEQQRRAESLRTRGGQIAGFAALFLVLIGGNAGRMIHESHGALRSAIGMLLIFAAACLGASVVAAVIGMSRHRPYATISADEVDNYLTDPFLDAPELWPVQVRALRALKVASESAQAGANDALKSITVSLYAFVVGLAFAVTAVGIAIGELI